MQIDDDVLREVEAALVGTRRLVAEAAGTGFNWQDGDWAERLYANNGTISAALARLRKAMEDAQDAADAQKAYDELICECGMMGPCMSPECKSPLLSCKAMEAKDGCSFSPDLMAGGTDCALCGRTWEDHTND